jgi:hypothetical protein
MEFEYKNRNSMVLTLRHQELPTSNCTRASSQGITDIFNEMFSGGIPDKFSMSPTKQQYMITDGLGPYFRKKLLEDCSNSWYTLSYDETTNAESKKELQISIRY